MNGIKRTTAGIGKVILVLVGGILFPILIWVALGVAINQKLRAGKVKQAPAPTIAEILATAGLAGREATK